MPEIGAMRLAELVLRETKLELKSVHIPHRIYDSLKANG
jgi:hypothetical protein